MKYQLLAMLFVIFGLALTAYAEDSPIEKKWGKTIANFEMEDAQHPPQTGRVLFIGSSSIRLWDLKTSFPDLVALNRGFGGSEVADSVYFFDRIVAPYQPRLIVMYAGDNDIAHEKTPAQVHADFQQFVAKMKQHLPETKLVYIAIKPSLKRWNLIEQVRAANALIAETCAQDPHLTFLDIDAPMLNGDGQPRAELFVKDGLHLSPEGYQIWSDLLRPHLRQKSQ